MFEDVLFIVNPISGNGRKDAIVSLIRKRGGKVAFTGYAGHAAELAAHCAERTVVAVGGDGTVNEVARGLLGTGKTLGIVPCGSGDGLALHLGISRNPSAALDAIERGKTRSLDCGLINGRPFFSVCGVGLDAVVSKRFAEASSRGLSTYIREALSVWRGFTPTMYNIVADGVEMQREAVLITAANSDQWGNNARIAPMARCDDGFLDVAVLGPFSSAEIPVLAAKLMTGRLDGSRSDGARSVGARSVGARHLEYLRCRSLEISRPSPGPAHFDGDCFEAGETLSISLTGEKLRVICG